MNSDSEQQASIKTNEFGDTYIDIINHRHFHTNSAAKIYTQIFLEKLSDSKTLYVIIGTDSGLFPNYLSKLPTPEGTRYLFIELDLIKPVINELLKNETDIAYPISSPSHWEKDLSEQELNKYIYDDRVKIIKSLAATDGKIEDYNDLFQQVKVRLNSINHELITTTAQIDHIKNRIINAIDNIRSFSELENIATGPALIVGAGPSLNDNLDWVRSHQDKITIIAVSRTYQLLKQNGIHPDIVVSIDPQEINYQNSKAILDSNDFIFVHSNHVSPQLLAQWNGISFFCGPLLPWKTDEKLENQQHTGPTVTHFALTIASAMGFDDIYLAGVDFCFEASGISHADGSALPVDKEEAPTVTTYGGEIAYTNFFFENSVRYLGEIAAGHTGKIFNLSLNAANVESIAYTEEPVISGIKWRLPEITETSQNQRYSHIEEIKKELLKARTAYSEILKLCKNAINLNKKPATKTNYEKHLANQVKIDKIEHKLTSKFPNYLPVAQNTASADLLKLLNQADQKEKSETERQTWIDKYYKAHLKGTKLIIKAIDEALLVSNVRILEYSLNNNIKTTIEFFVKKNQLGRCCILLNDNKSSNTEFTKKLLEYLCSFFKHNLKFNTITKSTIEQLSNHVVQNLDQGIIERLKSVVTNQQQNENTTPLYLLQFSKAVLEQIQGNHESAKKTYRQLIETFKEASPQLYSYINHGLLSAIVVKASEIDIFFGLKTGSCLIESLKSNRSFTELDSFFSLIEIKSSTHSLYLIRKRVIEKSLEFFRLNDRPALIELDNSVSSIIPHDKENPIRLFLLAVLQQVDNNIEAASKIYTNLIDRLLPEKTGIQLKELPIVVKYSLLQMATIAPPEEGLKNYIILSRYDPKYLKNTAIAFHQKGDLKQAAYYFNQYLDLYPDDKDCFDKKEEIELSLKATSLQDSQPPEKSF